MNMNLRNRIDLFADNAQAIRAEFRWSFPQACRLAALPGSLEDRRIDPRAVRAAYGLVKREAGALSPFRGNLAVSFAARLAMSRDPEHMLRDTLAAFDGLKQAGFYRNDYLAFAALQIAANPDAAPLDQVVARARAFYEGLRRNHRLLTGRDDYIFCAMLGLSDIDPDAGVSRIEALYTRLKPEFRWSSAVQNLAEVLVLGGGTDNTCDRLVMLRDQLRDRGVRMDRALTLSSLGVLALLPVNERLVVEDLLEVRASLREKKGFGAWSVMNQELLPLSTALVASEQLDLAKKGAYPALATTIASIILAQQAAVAAAAASAAAASAASSSSS